METLLNFTALGNLPIYPGWANNRHSGFAFTFKNGQHRSAEVLGVAFGTSLLNLSLATKSFFVF